MDRQGLDSEFKTAYDYPKHLPAREHVDYNLHFLRDGKDLVTDFMVLIEKEIDGSRSSQSRIS